MAYLSQSKYGKYGNTAYTGASKEIYKMIVLVIIQEEVLV